jgi:hypothetical protein
MVTGGRLFGPPPPVLVYEIPDHGYFLPIWIAETIPRERGLCQQEAPLSGDVRFAVQSRGRVCGTRITITEDTTL